MIELRFGPAPGAHPHTREDSGLMLHADGHWSHDGEPIEHAGVVAAFNRAIGTDSQGRPVLRVGGDWCVIGVEDTLYRVEDVILPEPGLPAPGAIVILNDGSREPLDATGLATRGDVLYVPVKGGRWWARFARLAQSRFILAVGEEGPSGVGVRLQGRFTAIPEHPGAGGLAVKPATAMT